MRYEDAAAFRAALADNLRDQHPDKDLSRLLKRTMMERFLARTSAALPQQAILKGGYALELRLHQARAGDRRRGHRPQHSYAGAAGFRLDAAL